MLFIRILIEAIAFLAIFNKRKHGATKEYWIVVACVFTEMVVRAIEEGLA